MSPKKIVGGLVGKAAGAAKHPFGTAGQALGLAKGAVATGVTVAEGVAHVAADRLRARQGKGGGSDQVTVTPDRGGADKAAETAAAVAGKAADHVKEAADKAETAVDKAAESTRQTARKTAKKAAKKSPASKPAKPAEPRQPEVVLAEPAPPAEPPIDIVEQVLAAEEENHDGHATEPKAASRDEEHGEAAMQQAELDEIAEEQAEAAPQGTLDIDTPVGTTGADVGHNPDTAEADLQQPQTEPLVDPATTKSVKAEADVAKKAARSRKR